MPNNIIDDRITDVINSASKYNSIKRVGIFGYCEGNELYALGSFSETGGLGLIYDYDETGEGSTEELLDYIESVDIVVRHILSVPNIRYVCYSKTAVTENTVNDVTWIYECGNKRLQAK